ncbi:hypothetical protein QAD02_000736 [Eretmocerus hayati]|uniref:Uncharacterized protein n=1 Tax=Eretmocerus hayati TaxID=131215 RepID=A0ACC2NGX0_9HYME|nr:hypothetical protein QAD02_000736 [Eretmocerus hayati]
MIQPQSKVVLILFQGKGIQEEDDTRATAAPSITLESQPLQVRIALPHDPAPSDLLPNVEPLDKDDTRATAAPSITLESQIAHSREPQPHSKTVALPHDPAPSDFFSNVESLDKDDAGALAALSVSLAATTLGDALPGPLHAWRNHNDPAPSSEDEGIEIGKTLPHEKTCVVGNSLSFPPPRKYTGVGAPHSSEEGRTDTTDEPIAPTPPLRRRRRSRAERAARSAAWARSVFESTSSAKYQIERARDTHPVAPKFQTPNVFAQRPTCIMVFVEREPLFELAENYYEAECTDTEDALIGFVRENCTRRRVRNRVARHRGRRAAAVRRERRMAQERAEELDAIIAQAVAPALQQPAEPVQLVAPIPVQQQHAPVQRPEELPPALEPAAPEAVDEIVREFAAAAREDARMEVDQVADPSPFEGLLHFAPRDPRAAAPEPAFALFEAQGAGEDQDDVMPLLRLVAELPPLEGAPAAYPAGQAAPPHDLVHNGAQDADARGPGYYRAELLSESEETQLASPGPNHQWRLSPGPNAELFQRRVCSSRNDNLPSIEARLTLIGVKHKEQREREGVNSSEGALEEQKNKLDAQIREKRDKLVCALDEGEKRVELLRDRKKPKLEN